MSPGLKKRRELTERLRLALPLSGRARQQLLERLSEIISPEAARSNLLITDVYDAGEEHGLLCQLDLTRYDAKVSYLVVPFDQLAIDPRYDFSEKPHRQGKRVATRRTTRTRGK